MTPRRTARTGIELPKRAAAPPPPAPADETRVEAQLHPIKAVAIRLALSEPTLRRLIAAGRVRTVRIGVLVRISEAEVRRIVRDGTTPSQES
jgi:excisionase family DNA binding protein